MQNNNEVIAQRAAMTGNLKALSNDERWQYYLAMCIHLDLDPVSRPFDWIDQEGRLTLYPNANCASQLADKMGLSFPEYKAETIGEVYIFRVKAVADGRECWATGAVPMGKSADQIARAIKKAETQAKRRAALSMGGLALTESDEIQEIGGVVFEQAIIGQSADLREIKNSDAQAIPPAEPKSKRGRPAKELPPAPIAEAPEAPAQAVSDEERMATAKKTAWGWMKKLHITDDDARQIWRELNGNLDMIEEFLKIFPNKVPVVVSAAESLSIFVANQSASKSLPIIAEYGEAKAGEIIGAVKTQSPAPAVATYPKEAREIFDNYIITENERWPIWSFFSGVPLDEGGPFLATEDFLTFRTSIDVEPSGLEISLLLNIWAATDGHLRKAKQRVAEEVLKPKTDAKWFDDPGQGITKANRDLSQDAVLFDVTAVWKWIKTSGLDCTKPNRDRINAIISGSNGDWKHVVAEIKRDFSK